LPLPLEECQSAIGMILKGDSGFSKGEKETRGSDEREKCLHGAVGLVMVVWKIIFMSGAMLF
jgi:hypothetical protein